jgi:hypothetical protein
MMPVPKNFKRLSVTTIAAPAGTIAFFAGEEGAEDCVEPVIAFLVEVREADNGEIATWVTSIGIEGEIDRYDAISVEGAIVRRHTIDDGVMQTTSEFQAARKLAKGK